MSINNLNTYLNIKDSHLRVVSGNVYAQAMNIGGINVETAHGLQSVSNTGNVTSNTLQFSNAITGFVTTANAQIGRDLVVSGNTTVSKELTVTSNATVSSNLNVSDDLIVTNNILASNNLTVTGNATISGNVHAGGEIELYSNLNIQQVSNTATIKATSNVVTEFSRSKKLIKYPRVNLTADAQSSAGGYEGYIVNQSSVYSSESSHGAYLAFRGNSHWLSSSNSFDGGDDVFNGTNGPWISIQLPTKINLEYLEFSAASGRLGQLITAGSVYASNNGSTWINIGSLDNLGTYTNFVPAHVDFTHTTLYDRYLLHVTANATNYVHMEKLSLFGIPEYDPEAHGTDVTVKSYPNVPNTDWLEVYYDAKDLADGSITTVDDLTPSGTNDGTPINVTVSDGAFVFNGTDSRISSSITQSAGAYVHTAGLWYYTNDDPATLGDYIYQLGSGGTNTSPSIQISSGKLYISFMSNYYENPVSSVGIVSKKWVHIFYSYDGSATTSNSVSVYINGVKMSMSGPIGASAGTALSLGANPQLRVGCSYSNGSVVNGSIANFRLFNRALTSDEIYQLYTYQKEDFGHSTNNMTLKAGRLGIGTSEPRAMLDVRGILKASVGLFQDKPSFMCPVAIFGAKSIPTSTTMYDYSTRDGLTLSNRGVGGSAMRWKLGVNGGRHTNTMYPTNNVNLVRVFDDTTSETSGVQVPYEGYYLCHNFIRSNSGGHNMGNSFITYSESQQKYITASINGYMVPWGGSSGASGDYTLQFVSAVLYLRPNDKVIFSFWNQTSYSGGFEQFVSLAML